MILSAQTIRKRLNDPLGSDLLIEPFCKRTVVNGMSFGLSCAGYDLRAKIPQGSITLRNGDFALITTVEKLGFPDDVMGALADKSTWARRGLAVQNTIFEPGWYGFPTIEISNHGWETITICDGFPIAQMIFHQVDKPVEKPYSGKYQGQGQVATPAKEET